MLLGQAEPVVEQRRAVADGDRQAADRRADGLTGVERRVVEVGVLADELALGHSLGRAAVQSAQQRAQVAAAGSRRPRSWRRRPAGPEPG